MWRAEGAEYKINRAMGILLKTVSLLATNSLLSPLDQSITNGMSSLGTLSAPLLPHFLKNNPLPNGFPWGTDNTYNTNPYHSSPSTGMTRKYDFTISRSTMAPDGFERQMITINGMFPGPTIEANWGDTMQVTVHNDITDDPEGTSIHWHGFLQHQSQFMDGTPGFSQCPIAPSKTFTYSFKAELYGTSWYHAHFSSQYVDGVFGPIVIYGPLQDQYDIDLGPVTLNDYYHVDYYTMLQGILAPRPNLPPPETTSDNNLINGKMNFDCSMAPPRSKCQDNGGLAKFKFTSGKRHRLRLINAGADGTQQLSIDGHTMEVIANDFVTIEPYNTTVATLGIGQRTDVIVTATGKPKSSYWMRSNITCASSNQPNALAAIYYEKADTTAEPTSQPWTYDNVGCANDDLSGTVPTYAISPGEPDVTITLEITAGQNDSSVWLWYMNNSSFRTDYNGPVLEHANKGNTSYPDSPEWNVFNTGSNSSYRFITINNSPLAHPMHFHGHNMYILFVGEGLTWDGTIVNPCNPQRRDVQMLPAGGHLVWQVDAENPGAWPYHCHIAWHASNGFAIDILEQPQQIAQIDIPDDVYQLCRDWDAFEATGQVDQIDSGLKN